MTTDLLTNIPATSTTRARARESKRIGPGLPSSENRGIVEAKKPIPKNQPNDAVMFDEKTLRRFFLKIHRGESCWLWKGISKKGDFKYGIFNLKGKHYLAHRISYQIYQGPIPSGLCVLHKCDNPSCVNPGHLFLGTKKENTADMIRKGRQWIPEEGTYRNSKLTKRQVIEIRERYKKGGISHAKLAKEYGVGKRTIGYIVTGKSWRLEKEAPQAYKNALLLVARIDSDLTRGTGHYWTKAGELLYSLDQVVRAIIVGELMEPEG